MKPGLTRGLLYATPFAIAFWAVVIVLILVLR